jgi:hypothetical protein
MIQETANSITQKGYKSALKGYVFDLRPYHAENTGSRPITAVKPHRVSLVLGWATALEPKMP